MSNTVQYVQMYQRKNNDPLHLFDSTYTVDCKFIEQNLGESNHLEE